MQAAVPAILVILLHGVGSSGRDLAPLADLWRETLPGAVFVSPDAPSPSSFGSGFQWFSAAGVTEENRAARITEARPSFDNTISRIIADNGFSERLDHVAFVGFSQGTIMALDAVSSGRWPVGAVVGFSGRLASPEPLAPSVSTPVLLVHGMADPVIPAKETPAAAARLQSLGLTVETLMEQGLGHTISNNGAHRAGAFLAKSLAD